MQLPFKQYNTITKQGQGKNKQMFVVNKRLEDKTEQIQNDKF